MGVMESIKGGGQEERNEGTRHTVFWCRPKAFSVTQMYRVASVSGRILPAGVNIAPIIDRRIK